MYIQKDDITTCRCGLKNDETDFVDFRCIGCYVDDYSSICILCGYIDSHEIFTNNLCTHCFEWCAA